MESFILSIAEVYGIDARIDVINHHGMTDQEIITRILEKYEIDQATIESRLADCQACMVRNYAAIVKSEAHFECDSQRRAFHFGDAPQDMLAAREAGVVPIGVATGVYTAQQLTSAGAGKVFSDLQDADDILGFLI